MMKSIPQVCVVVIALSAFGYCLYQILVAIHP